MILVLEVVVLCIGLIIFVVGGVVWNILFTDDCLTLYFLFDFFLIDLGMDGFDSQDVKLFQGFFRLDFDHSLDLLAKFFGQ